MDCLQDILTTFMTNCSFLFHINKLNLLTHFKSKEDYRIIMSKGFKKEKRKFRCKVWYQHNINLFITDDDATNLEDKFEEKETFPYYVSITCKEHMKLFSCK